MGAEEFRVAAGRGDGYHAMNLVARSETITEESSDVGGVAGRTVNEERHLAADSSEPDASLFL